MEIRELIELGQVAASQCKKPFSHTGGYYYSGKEYDNWLSLAVRFLENNYPNDKDTIRFSEIAEKAYSDSEHSFNVLIAILNAFDKIPVKPLKKEIQVILHDIFMNFNKFEISIKRRYGKRPSIEIADEHDLQDALYAILKLFVNDIRKEEYVPSYAGGKSRVDFFLPEHGVIIETKMATASLQDKGIGEQLIVDFNRYKELNNSNHLICFVYDKDSNINNPQGIIKDLEKLSDDTMSMTVFISPQ